MACETVVKSDVTLVTGFFDLDRRLPPGVPRRRPLDFYKERGRPVLNAGCPLVVYTERECVGLVTAPSEFPRRVVETRLEELEPYGMFEGIERNWAADRKVAYFDRSKVTPSYAVLMAGKSCMVRDVAASNPFGSKYVAWIDFALSHVAELGFLREALSVRPEKPRYVVMNHPGWVWNRCCGGSREAFYGSLRWVVAGGFFMWPVEAAGRMAGSLLGEAKAAVDDGFLFDDEQLLGSLVCREACPFEFAYGGHESCVSNFAVVRSGFADCARLVREAKEMGDDRFVREIEDQRTQLWFGEND